MELKAGTRQREKILKISLGSLLNKEISDVTLQFFSAISSDFIKMKLYG
jgi:hypothetical protein